MLCKFISLGRTASDPVGITVKHVILGIFFQTGNHDNNRDLHFHFEKTECWKSVLTHSSLQCWKLSELHQRRAQFIWEASIKHFALKHLSQSLKRNQSIFSIHSWRRVRTVSQSYLHIKTQETEQQVTYHRVTEYLKLEGAHKSY